MDTPPPAADPPSPAGPRWGPDEPGDIQELIRKYEPLCWKEARRFLPIAPAGLPVDDLVQQARVALARAAGRYDRGHVGRRSGRKAKFITAAIIFIRRELTFYVHDQRRYGFRGLGRERVGSMKQKIKVTRVCASGPEPSTSRDHGPGAFDMIRDAPCRPDRTPVEWPHDLWEKALDALNPAQRQVVVMRFLLGIPVLEIAAELGVSQQRVRQILEAAYARLRAKPWLAAEYDDRPAG